MSKLRQIVAHFIECLRDESQFQEPADQDNSVYLKPRPDILKPGQVWRARPLRERTSQTPWVDFNFVLSYISEHQDHCKGFLLIDGLEPTVLDLADEGDVKLDFGESPIDHAFVAVWRGEVNLVPDHLRSYYGDIPEAKLREVMDKYVPVITLRQAPPAQNPELQPVRDILWELTGYYDGEAIDKVLQD